MRGILIALCGVAATAGASLASDVPPPPSVAHPFAQPANRHGQAPVVEEQIEVPPPQAYGHDFAPVASAGHGRHDGSCWQRLRGWLTYRAPPAPRECKCRHTCAGCPAPLYSYFALRYPNGCHGPAPSYGHDSPFVTAPMQYAAPHNP